MKFFIHLRNSFKNLTLITEASVEADRLGFDGLLMPDHYMVGVRPRGNIPTPDDNVTLDTWIMLTHLAGLTKQIRLGTIVTPIPFRPPSILAKMISTVDILSNGRVILGVGAGWSREEFEGYSEWNEPKVRVDKTAEGVELIIKLWTQNEVTFNGNYYRAKAAVLEPKPIQKPYPQLLFAGMGTRMLKLAGRYADICYLGSRTSKEYETRKEIVLRAAKKVNRIGKIAFMSGANILFRTPYTFKEYIGKIESALEQGVSYFLTTFPQDETYIDAMRKFAKEVIPSFK